MNLLIDKSFEKDTAKIDKKLKLAIIDAIREVQNAVKLSDLTNCKKLKGSKTAYRIRIGEYSLGFVFEEQTVIFVRFFYPAIKFMSFFLNKQAFAVQSCKGFFVGSFNIQYPLVCQTYTYILVLCLLFWHI